MEFCGWYGWQLVSETTRKKTGERRKIYTVHVSCVDEVFGPTLIKVVVVVFHLLSFLVLVDRSE